MHCPARILMRAASTANCRRFDAFVFPILRDTSGPYVDLAIHGNEYPTLNTSSPPLRSLAPPVE